MAEAKAKKTAKANCMMDEVAIDLERNQTKVRRKGSEKKEAHISNLYTSSQAVLSYTARASPISREDAKLVA